MKNGLIQVDGKFYIKSRVVMLPTKEASVLCLGKISDQIKYYGKPTLAPDNSVINQNIYFLSDEEIKEGDYYLECFENTIFSVNLCNSKSEAETILKYQSDKLEAKKVIATTNSELTVFQEGVKLATGKIGIGYKSLPRPSNKFLQKYCDLGGEIDEVLIQVDTFTRVESTDNYEDDFIIKNSETLVDTIYRENVYDLSPKIHIAPDNTITIKELTKLSDNIVEAVRSYKTSWDREEVIEFGRLILDTFHSEGKTNSGKERLPRIKFDKWTEENL